MDQRLQAPAGAAPPDWQALCEELAEALCGYEVTANDFHLIRRARAALDAEPVATPAGPTRRQLMLLAEDVGMASVSEAAEYARAVLARWGRPVPAPAEGEVAELVEWLRDDLELYPAEKRRAADLLEQRHPAPVPVSERLPGPGDCNAEGQVWVSYERPDLKTTIFWELMSIDQAMKCAPVDSWLPFHALPLPSGEDIAAELEGADQSTNQEL